MKILKAKYESSGENICFNIEGDTNISAIILDRTFTDIMNADILTNKECRGRINVFGEWIADAINEKLEKDGNEFNFKEMQFKHFQIIVGK